jgi:putative hemolysin
MEFYILFFFLVILLFLSAFFSSSEVALFSLSNSQVKVFQSDPNPRRQLIAKLVHKSRDLLVTVFIMNTLVNIVLQNVASSMFEDYGNFTLKVGVPLLLTLIFGEIIPKNYGMENNLSLSYHVAPTIDWIQILIEPLRRFVVYITYPLSRILFFFLKKAESISTEELTHALITSKELGVLTNEEVDLAIGFMNLQSKSVREVMRSKEEILYYTLDEPLSKLLYLFADQECSRVPICSQNLQDVIGVLSARRFLLNRHKIQTSSDLKKYVEKPFFVPETISAKTLLRKFDSLKKHFALVVDEYGSIIGVITDEDIAEVIVGDITDLRDQEVSYVRQNSQEIIAFGKMEIAEFEEIYKTKISNPSGMVTLGGWLIQNIGEIPLTGTQYETENFLFKILSSDPKKVKKIYIRKKSKF